jgi:YidC/Oxa1 family membrane protein insertase
VRFFVGPKQFDLLQSVDAQLVRAINFGTFKVIAVPLLTSVEVGAWIHRQLGLVDHRPTIIINLLIFPLRHKSLVSMRKMQALQPQLKAIQDRYSGLKMTIPVGRRCRPRSWGSTRRRASTRLADAVPMLLTLPVLFAFYSLLSQSIELRGADFGWWIKDLSERDPVVHHARAHGR